jgi:hypothetical protein
MEKIKTYITVSELLQALQQCAPSAEVVIHQYGTGKAVSIYGVKSDGERVVLS